MDCIILKNGLESSLHKKLIQKYDREVADKKMAMFQSETFIKEFGDYNQLIEDKSEFIPKMFKGRLNDKFEPEIYDDESGTYYLDSQYQRQYIDIAESNLYNILQSQRAVNSLVEILGNNYIEKGGFNLDFDTLDMSDNKSKVSLLEAIKINLEELGLQLIQSDSDHFMNNGGALYQIANEQAALDELIIKIKDFYNSKQINYNEDYSLEDSIIETQNQKDPVFNQSSFKINPRNKITSMVKIRLSLIKNPLDLDLDFGQPKSIDYDNLYNKMTAILKNNPVTVSKDGKVEDVFETIIDKLYQHSGNIKYLSNVADYLEKISRLPVDLSTEEGINIMNFKASFVNVMNLQKNNLEYSEISSEEVIVTPAITEKVTLENGAIKNKVIKEAVKGLNYSYIKRDATTDTKIEKSILTSWELSMLDFFELTDEAKGLVGENKKQILKDIISKLESLQSNSKFTNEQKVDNIINKLLPSVGINVNEAAVAFALNELKNDKIDDVKLDLNRYNLIDNTVKMFKNIVANHNQGKSLVESYWYRQLAKAEAFYREDGSESSVFTAGETRYVYSNPSYLHNLINGWKKDRQLLVDLYESYGDNDVNSKLYSHLLGLDILDNKALQLSKSLERIQKFSINHFSSFLDKTNAKGKSKTNKDISKSEYIKDTINGLLHYQIDGVTHTRTTTAPGKSTQFNIEHDMFIKSGFSRDDNGNSEISTTVNLMYDTYLMGEFKRMESEYKKLNSSKQLKVYYHTKYNRDTNSYEPLDSKGKLVGNAFKSQLFPSLSFDQIDKSLEMVSGYPLYNTDGSIIMENVMFYKEQMLVFIEGKILDHIEDLKNDLLKYNIIERSGTSSYINKGIDGKILKKYTEGKFNLDEDTLFSMMGDIWLNGLVNHMEYSKLFSGDVAYYKDSVDYIKRIGASYTDGVYEYLTNDTKDFKVGVVEAVEFVEPYLEQLKEVIKSDEDLMEDWEGLINAADAQAWITPKRWKNILTGVGKYTAKHDKVYKKLISGTESLLPDELKLVAQPLKGVYFERDSNGAPIYLKYSQAVLIPQMINNSKLKDLDTFMKHHKLDELLTFDAIKAGSSVPTKIHDADGNVVINDENGNIKSLNTMTLSSRGWKLQQDLPTKTYKETDIGSQIIKNMLVLISHLTGTGQKTFEHNGNEYTAEEIAKELDSSLGELVKSGYNDLAREFDIDNDGVINNIDKFYNALADEVVSRDGSSEIVKALRAKLSIYAMPGLKNKLDNIFASIVNDRTVKIKTNGGSFIQMSNFGLSKDEATDKYKGIKWSPSVNNGETTKPYTLKRDVNGEIVTNIFGDAVIVPEEILISGSFIAKYIPNYEEFSSEELFGKINPETGELENGMIDSKILDTIIGYRIPNQGPSSNGAMKVVGILPPGAGDTIVAFTGITKKTGSDFDIDKMYIMFPNYKPRTNLKSETYAFFKDRFKGDTIKETIENLRSVFTNINDEQIAQVLQSNETRVEFVKDAFEELVNNVLNNRDKPEIKAIINELNIKVVSLKYTNSKGNSKEANQNKVIELYKTLILHKDNITKIMTPLDFEHIKMEAQNLAPAKTKSDLDNYEFIQDIVTKYSFLAGLAGVGQEANTSSDYAMGTMSNVYLADVNLGDRSHQGESFESISVDKYGNNEQVLKTLTKFDKINSVDISDAELRAWLESYNKRVSDPKKKLSFETVKSYKSFAISDNISALMNAFVDIAKDPYITNVNWNMMTTNTGNMMLRAGVHPFIVMSFLAQPIINEYIEFTSQYETRDKSNQVSNSKDAFRIYKVGELIKNDLIPVSKFDNGDIAEINARTLYDIVTLYNFDLNKLGENDFTAPRNLEKIKESIGLPKEHKLTDLDISQLKESIKPIIRNHGIFFTENFKDYIIDVDLGILRENVFKYDMRFQAKTFNTFLEFQGFSKKLKSSIDASKHGVNGMGKNTTQLLVAQNRISNIDQKGVINYNTKMYYEDGTPKFLAHLKTNNLDRTQNIVQNNPLLFVSSSSFVWNSYNKVSQNIYGINLEDDAQDGLGDKLDKVFNTYLMSGFEPFNLSNSEKSSIIEDFPNRFIEFKNKYAGKYKIIDELNVKKTETRLYITLDNKTNSKEYTDSMINSWRDLIKYYPEVGTDLIRYSFLTSGFNNNVASFFQFIPPSFFFQNDFNTYIKSFVNYPGSIDQNFIDHFYLSNLEDSQIVKYVNKGMKMKGQPYLKDGLTLFNANVTKEYLNMNGEYYKRVGTREVKGDTENIYTKYIKVEGGYALIAPIVSERDKGISINNYNSNRISLSLDATLTPETIKNLDIALSEINDNSIQTIQTDEFGQEDFIVKEPLTEFETIDIINIVNPKFYEGNITPDSNTIFVFGSNPQGRHGAGAAKIARTQFGAIYGQGEGLQGNSYALPTKDLRIKENRGFKSISINDIIDNIKVLYKVAYENPTKQFKIAYRNTTEMSLNGYTGLEMIDMFNKAGDIPDNIIFSKEWFDTGLIKSNIVTKNLYEQVDIDNIKNQLITRGYKLLSENENDTIGADITDENIEEVMALKDEDRIILDGKVAGRPEAIYNIIVNDNSSMEYTSFEDLVEDAKLDIGKFMTQEEKDAMINYIKSYGIDLSEKEFKDPNQLSLFPELSNEEYSNLSDEEKATIEWQKLNCK